MMIDDNIINDPLCNTIINKYYNKNDYIIIHNELLHKHLLSFIPPERFIYSTTLGIKDINLVNQYSKDNIYVLYYMYNNDNKYLAQLQYPHNIEIICAEQCIDNCSNRTNHYIALSKAAANIPLNENESTACPFKEKPLVLENAVEDYLKSFKHAVNNDRIEELSSLGINDFKLSGRERSTALFFIFALYYLMYPQYRKQAQKELIVETEKLKFKYKLTGQV
jgi:collagenase-like PrtC family protease